VGPNYTSGVAFDYEGNQLGKWTGGDYQAHFANFVKAIKSRNYKDLASRHRRWASLQRAGPPRQRFVPARQVRSSPETRPSQFADNKHVTETLATLEEHLKENGVDFKETKVLPRPGVDHRPQDRTLDRQGRESVVHA